MAAGTVVADSRDVGNHNSPRAPGSGNGGGGAALRSCYPFASGRTDEYKIQRRGADIWNIDWNATGTLIACGFRCDSKFGAGHCVIIDPASDRPTASTVRRPEWPHASSSGGIPPAVTGEVLYTPHSSNDATFSSSRRFQGDSAGLVAWHKTNPSVLTTAGHARDARGAAHFIRFWDLRENDKDSVGAISSCFRSVPLKLEVNDRIYSSCMSPDGNLLAVTTLNNILIKVDLRTYKTEAIDLNEEYTLNELAFSADSKHVFIANKKKSSGMCPVLVFDMDAMEKRDKPFGCTGAADSGFPDEELLMIGHQGMSAQIAYDHRHSRLLTGGQDSLVNIWDAHSGTCMHAMDVMNERIR